MDSSQSPDELRARISDLERRLKELEARPGSGAQLLERLLPPDVRGHFRTGSREQLLAVRSLIDHWIGRLDPRQRDTPAPPHQDIPIE